MAEIEKRNTMLALRMQQAEEIRQAVACFIPENEEKQGIFTKNCLFYLIKNKASLQGDKVVLPKANGEPIQIDIFEYLQKMYLASKAGLSLIDGDFQFVPFGGKNPTISIVPDFRSEKKIAESKGLVISFIHGRAEDEANQLPIPLQYEFVLRSKKTNNFAEIQKVNAYTQKVVNDDTIWYAAVAQLVDNPDVTYAYVESKQNILMRANPATLKFYEDPNAHHVMFEKFVLRQLLKNLPSNLRGVDFDKWLPNFDAEEVPYEEVVENAPKPSKNDEKPKISGEKKPLEKGSDTWDKMAKAIADKKVTDLAQIERKYAILDENRQEIIDMFVAAMEGEEAPAESPMTLFNE